MVKSVASEVFWIPFFFDLSHSSHLSDLANLEVGTGGFKRRSFRQYGKQPQSRQSRDANGQFRAGVYNLQQTDLEEV